ncbi:MULTISPECIES: hypothetical protein [unclassified Bacteroides]|uniref:hypothetical protein n=1 Tax=unclassified Bacteroides TaxID=2646097 RepID=UPI0004E26688|nr:MULTISPECIES: hypothetical protein [unclassified Bacteroides]
MKKLNICLLALLAMFSLSARAGYRVLFTENYESATSVSDTKWGSNANYAGLSIAGDDYGKYVQISAGQNNQRSYNTFWGKDIYTPLGNLDEYEIQFDFCVSAMGTNQYNSEVAIITEDAAKKENGPTSGGWLFKLDQVKNNDDASILNYTVNGNASDVWTPAVGTWYTFYLTVNVAERKVSYYAKDLSGNTALADGEYTVPEDVDMKASGLWYAHARYQNVVFFDNISVLKNLGDGVDWANDPVVALTGLNQNERTYTISFMEGEDLHFTGTDGNEQVVSFYDCETQGQFVYTTTTSGSIVAYTQVNETKSQSVTVDVDASVISLPEATAEITSVQEGYAKKFKINVDNSNVPLQPVVVFDYTFTPENGEAVTKEELTSGSVIEVNDKGTLVVTTKAYGYAPTTTTIVNDKSYKVLNLVNFQSLAVDELKANGFESKGVLAEATGGGENTWTSGGRLYAEWVKGTEVGDTTRVFPYGRPVDGAYVGSGIERMQLLQSKLTPEKAKNLFDIITVWNNTMTSVTSLDADGNFAKDDNGNVGGTVNVEVKVGIGLINPGVQGDAQNYDPAKAGYGNIRVANTPIYVDAPLGSFVVAYKICGYGNDSAHPYLEGTSEDDIIAQYKAMNTATTTEVYPVNENTVDENGRVSFNLYRIDTALARVEVLVEDGAATSVAAPEAVEVVEDANAPIYTIGGVKVSTTEAGKIYIQNGKKFLAK